MSNLLSQASLVMIPSGYKEDVVYSPVPTDGSGDLSFTRASNGTRVNSAGLVEVCPWNLFRYSNDFSNAAWTKYNATLTSGQSDPFGGNNAWKFQAILSAQSDFRQTVTGASSYSFYAKAGSVSEFRLWSGSSGTIFDTSTGTVASGSGTIESVGNGWYRCTILTSTTGSVTLIPYFVGNANDYIYIAFGQAQASTTAKPYFPTTDRLNVPRLTYQNGGGGCPSLLLEKQSTNLTLYSDQLDNAVHTLLGITITANNITSPDGTQNADKITETTANSEHIVYDIDSNASGTYTLSAFFKGGAGTIFPVLRLNGADATAYAGCIFNTSTGAVVNTFYNTYSAPSTKVENMGNGWYRVSMTTTTTNSNFGMRIAASDSASPSVGSYGAITYNGSTSNYFYAYGAQLEASSYPTSYIPTTSSSATRVADACYKTGISSLIGQTEGTIFIDCESFATASTNVLFMIGDGTTNNRVEFYWTGANNGTFVVGSGGTIQVLTSVGLIQAQRNKIAVVYKANDFAIYANGVALATASSGSVPTSFTAIEFGEGSSFIYMGKINQVCLFKTRLTNAELASITSL